MTDAPAPRAAVPADATARVPSFAWPTLLLLYLGPGLAMTLFYVAVAPRLLAAGLPAVWGLLIGAIVIITPLEVGIVLLHSRRLTGRAQLRPAVAMLAPLGGRQLGWLVPVAVLGVPVLPEADQRHAVVLGVEVGDGIAIERGRVVRNRHIGLPIWFAVTFHSSSVLRPWSISRSRCSAAQRSASSTAARPAPPSYLAAGTARPPLRRR